MAQLTQKSIHINDAILIRELFGSGDQHAHMIKKELGVDLVNRDDVILLSGEASSVDLAEELLRLLIEEKDKNSEIGIQKVEYFIQQLLQGNTNTVRKFVSERFI